MHTPYWSSFFSQRIARSYAIKILDSEYELHLPAWAENLLVYNLTNHLSRWCSIVHVEHMESGHYSLSCFKTVRHPFNRIRSLLWLVKHLDYWGEIFFAIWGHWVLLSYRPFSMSFETTSYLLENRTRVCISRVTVIQKPNCIKISWVGKYTIPPLWEKMCEVGQTCSSQCCGKCFDCICRGKRLCGLFVVCLLVHRSRVARPGR